MPMNLHDTILSENPLPKDADNIFTYFGLAPNDHIRLNMSGRSGNVPIKPGAAASGDPELRRAKLMTFHDAP
jgi:hypothetical protein